jgi:hypothetical protein
MGDEELSEDEMPLARTDDGSEEGSEPSSSDDKNEQDHAEKATDPAGDIASGGGEQPL